MLQGHFEGSNESFPALYNSFFKLNGDSFDNDFSFCEGYEGCGDKNVYMNLVDI